MAAENNSKRTLLTAADPALFEVVNHSGGAPAMVCCDHAGLALPAALGDLGVPAAAMATHIASDLGAKETKRPIKKEKKKVDKKA